MIPHTSLHQWRKNRSSKWLFATNRWLALGLALFLAITGFVPSMLAQSGNLGSTKIEIDNSANLYPGDANILNSPATVDWVKDSLVNTDTDPNPNDSIAVGITPGVTGAQGGTGHWQGVRIVDGIAGNDQDIFLTGGKENDTSTWNVGPGSVGSSKYDITQAYIANNQTYIYFGMERRGNNGTTAFDFEFNQVAPTSIYVPTRTNGDVLLTFEMQGAGNTGSAVAHYFVWNGSSYVEQSSLPTDLVTSINQSAITPAPWGYVDSKGNWVLTPDIPRFEFAEAQVPLSLLPGVDGCGGSAFVQVRTRSSSTDNSDLKDATKIFEYSFGGPTAHASLTTGCALSFGFDGTTSTNSNGVANTGLTYSWTFQKSNGAGGWTDVGTSTLSNGTFSAATSGAGTYRALLTVTQTACSDDETTSAIDVAELTASASKTLATASTLTVRLSGTAAGASSYQWQRESGANNWVNITGANGTTLDYSSFEADSTPTVPFNFTIGSDSYAGKQWIVNLRLHAERTVNGNICTADSLPVPVKKVTGVDP